MGHKDGIHKDHNGQYELRSTAEATAAAGREEAVLQNLVQRPDFEKGEEQRARSLSEFKRITTAKSGEGGREGGREGGCLNGSAVTKIARKSLRLNNSVWRIFSNDWIYFYSTPIFASTIKCEPKRHT